MLYHISCGLFPHAVPGCTRYVLTIEHQQQIDVFMIYRRLLSHVLMIMKIMKMILIEAYCLGSYGNGAIKCFALRASHSKKQHSGPMCQHFVN